MLKSHHNVRLSASAEKSVAYNKIVIEVFLGVEELNDKEYGKRGFKLS